MPGMTTSPSPGYRDRSQRDLWGGCRQANWVPRDAAETPRGGTAGATARGSWKTGRATPRARSPCSSDPAGFWPTQAALTENLGWCWALWVHLLVSVGKLTQESVSQGGCCWPPVRGTTLLYVTNRTWQNAQHPASLAASLPQGMGHPGYLGTIKNAICTTLRSEPLCRQMWLQAMWVHERSLTLSVVWRVYMSGVQNSTRFKGDLKSARR